MSDMLSVLRSRIENKTATVGIIGLGYVGLPLARAFTAAGFRVLGFDIDPGKIAKLNAGRSYIKQIPHAAIAEMRAGGFEATDQFDRLGEPDAVLICVPTPLTDAREPDLTYVVNSAHAIAAKLRRGQLIVLESTTYPTTTRNVVLPVLERGGLAAGRDFFLAFSPEREDPGNPTYSVTSIPKVVGGLDDASGDAACAMYRAVVPNVVRVSTAEVAEACKILENTYRAINIALVNEMKVLYDRMGIDVWEVIDAAKTKPFGFQAFYPGPGLGGHCLAGHEWVTVRDKKGLHTIHFAELFERFRDDVRSETPGVEEVHPAGLEALSVNTETGAAEFAPVTHLFRRPEATPMLRVNVKGNRHLTVTDGHPMLVRGYEGIEERRADDLKPGDEVVLLASWPADSELDAAMDQVNVLLCGDSESPLIQNHSASGRKRRVKPPQPVMAGATRERVSSAVERTREPAPRSWHDHGSYATAEVVAIERAEPGPVYSMEVEGNHTFVTSYGIAVHNCIPLDPFYLSWIARQYGFNTRFIELAGEVNTAMPAYVISKVADALNDAGKPVRGSRVHILGMAYKKDVDDPRESPGFELMDLLLKKGAVVTYHDPHIPELPRMRHWPHLAMTSSPHTAEFLAERDCVLIATDHSAYDYGFIAANSKLLVDTRNATKAVASRENIVRA
jgi:UDP-N-acetyl-D-mannosaminuronate dehydrogenase